MQKRLRVHKLPRLVAEEVLAGSAVVVIDLLRASSTICQALASGAHDVVPFLEVDETLAAAATADRSEIVLGGERSGGRIPGFDLGNSPSEYTPNTVGGRRVYITTTNGTRSLYHARLAYRIVVGSFLNLSAVAASLKDQSTVDILCAGTGGEETREDILAAGAYVSRLTESSKQAWEIDDVANDTCRQWDALVAAAHAAGRPLNEHLALELRDTPGGRNLLGIGLDQDLADCAQIDRFSIVPEFNASERRIHLP